MKKKFIFPKGVRFSIEDEIPNNDDKNLLLSKIKEAEINVGYTFTKTDMNDYKYYAELNISAPFVWNIFKSLSISLLSEIAAPILGFIDDQDNELFYGPYSSRDEILQVFSEYEYELNNDGLFQFGIIYQLKGKTEEIFVRPTKHFTVWTNDEIRFKDVMKANDIPEYEELSFIDEFPRTTLAKYEGQTKEHTQVINELKEKFMELEKH